MINRKLFWLYGLSASIYFTQGIEGLPGQALFNYFKNTLNLTPERVMILGSWISLVWWIKPFAGHIIDNFFTRRIWIWVSLFLSIISSLILGNYTLPLFGLVMLLFLSSSYTAFRDVSVDGIMCVEGKKHQITGKIQSIQWNSIYLAGLLIGVIGGYISQNLSYKVGFLLLIPIYVVVGLITYFYKEEKIEKSHYSIKNLFRDLKILFKNKTLMITSWFIFLYNFSPDFSVKFGYIIRDNFKWSEQFIGNLTTISALFTILGAVLYYKWSTKINIPKCLFISVLLGAITTLCYLYYTPITAIIYRTLFVSIGTFIFMMLLDFMAQNTINGLESTSFALLCSVTNFTSFINARTGAYLLPKIGLVPLIIISSFTSFLCLPLINKLKIGDSNALPNK
jgi:MFS family permease